LNKSTAFFINGGAGRTLASIPAFENYYQDNPEDNFIIVCESGTDFFKGHPILHNKAYDVWHKGLFENFINDRICVSPEPYRVWEYYNQKCNIAQAFDIEINQKGLRDLHTPKIYFNKQEITSAASVIDEVKEVTGFDKVLVVQPFGRSVETVGKDYIIDPTSRSFQLDNIIDIINQLRKEYAVIIMSETPITFEKDIEQKYPVAKPQIPDIRIWAAILEIADHFLGCDSLGQHIVKSLGKTATVVLGSTYPINISYPNDKNFDIIDVGQNKRKYSPIRISIDEEIDRFNDESMELSKKQIEDILTSVRKRLGKSAKKPEITQKKDLPKLTFKGR